MAITQRDLGAVFESRPFRIRNADEFDFLKILDLFVDPTDGTKSPFDFDNSIVKGRMGAGKTMFLRANQTFHLMMTTMRLLNEEEIILPIYLRLSDYQHISDPTEIYKSIIIGIIKEMTSSYLYFLDSPRRLEFLHKGISSLVNGVKSNLSSDLYQIAMDLAKMSSLEYSERSKQILSGNLGIKSNFFELSIQSEKESEQLIKGKGIAGIENIDNVYKILLEPFDGKLLILFDEVGSLNRSFFRNDNERISMFGTIMNQLRTRPYIRTKIAIYPDTYSDVLAETRYGDVITLQEDIKDEQGFKSLETRGIILIAQYVKEFSGIACIAEDIFDYSSNKKYVIEHIINASDGNLRRFVQLLDLAMEKSFRAKRGSVKVRLEDVISAINENAKSMEAKFSQTEVEFLNSIAKACRKRSTYRFKYPYKSGDLQRYINKSEEYNIIKISEPGGGRKSVVYEFDYAYAVLKDIPTHYSIDSERIERTRSRYHGTWIKRITNIKDDIDLLEN